MGGPARRVLHRQVEHHRPCRMGEAADGLIELPRPCSTRELGQVARRDTCDHCLNAKTVGEFHAGCPAFLMQNARSAGIEIELRASPSQGGDDVFGQECRIQPRTGAGCRKRVRSGAPAVPILREFRIEKPAFACAFSAPRSTRRTCPACLGASADSLPRACAPSSENVAMPDQGGIRADPHPAPIWEDVEIGVRHRCESKACRMSNSPWF